MPKKVSENIADWKKILPDYEFMRWNEDNWDISSNAFATYFYSKGRRGYGFVGDPIRVDVLDRFGGVYLDTDVVVSQSFDPLLMQSLVIGRLYDNALGTATILAEKHNPRIHELVNLYDSYRSDFLDNPHTDKVSNGIFTRYFLNKNIGLKFGNEKQMLDDGTIILPKHSFELPAFWFERNDYSTHLATGSWQSGRTVEGSSSLKSLIAATFEKYSPALIARHRNHVDGKNNSISKQFGNKDK